MLWRAHRTPPFEGAVRGSRVPITAAPYFVHDETQRQLAEASKAALAASGALLPGLSSPRSLPTGGLRRPRPITRITNKKNPMPLPGLPLRLRPRSVLEEAWAPGSCPLPTGKWDRRQAAPGRGLTPSRRRGRASSSLTTTLSARPFLPRYEVTQREGTESPFANEYYNHKGEGIYVDVVSGEPHLQLPRQVRFRDPGGDFTKPLEAANIVEKTDRRLRMPAPRCGARQADSHLGHVFEDGPAPRGCATASIRRPALRPCGRSWTRRVMGPIWRGSERGRSRSGARPVPAPSPGEGKWTSRRFSNRAPGGLSGYRAPTIGIRPTRSSRRTFLRYPVRVYGVNPRGGTMEGEPIPPLPRPGARTGRPGGDRVRGEQGAGG